MTLTFVESYLTHYESVYGGHSYFEIVRVLWKFQTVLYFSSLFQILLRWTATSITRRNTRKKRTIMVDMLPVPGPGHEFPAAGVGHLGHAQGRDPETGVPGPLDGALDSLAALKLPWRRLGSWWSTV